MKDSQDLYGPDMQQMFMNSIFESDLAILFEKLADFNFNNKEMNKDFITKLKERLSIFKFDVSTLAINENDLNTALSIIYESTIEVNKNINKNKINYALEFSKKNKLKGCYKDIPNNIYMESRKFIDKYPVLTALAGFSIWLFQEPIDESRLKLQKQIISVLIFSTEEEISIEELPDNLLRETKHDQIALHEDLHLKLELFSQDED